MVLYLFPDTNVFLQCKPLEQVDWSPFGTWDKIQVVLARPVQTEIDALKSRGNSRQAARARKASTLIRQLLDADDGCITLRSRPPVQLCLRHGLRRDESVADQLNYEERDDQLVGTALAFRKLSPTGEVWLLTNDTGPMASAQFVGLSYFVVPEDWLLPPEADEAEKREKKLEAELDRYRSAEPSFAIEALPHEPVNATVTAFNHLAASEVEELLRRLVARFPLATDFGPAERQERNASPRATSVLYGVFGPGTEVFEPATQEEIASYKKAYADWKQASKETLSYLADILNSRRPWPEVTIRVSNVGSRPANDTLITFACEGRFWLVPAKSDDGHEVTSAAADESLLSRPPAAPQGTWRRVDQFATTLGALNHIQDLAKLWTDHEPVVPSLYRQPPRQDPNGIYLKEGFEGVPSERVTFTCVQWRHAQEPESFTMMILCPRDAGTYKGVLSVTVHAANMTEPKELKLPLQLTINEASCLDLAAQMVAGLDA